MRVEVCGDPAGWRAVERRAVREKDDGDVVGRHRRRRGLTTTHVHDIAESERDATVIGERAGARENAGRDGELRRGLIADEHRYAGNRSASAVMYASSD